MDFANTILVFVQIIKDVGQIRLTVNFQGQPCFYKSWQLEFTWIRIVFIPVFRAGVPWSPYYLHFSNICYNKYGGKTVTFRLKKVFTNHQRNKKEG